VFRQKGNATYWAFHRLVFANPRGINDAQLAAWASQVGANGAKVLAALRSGVHQKGLDADLQAARQLGVRGTPDSRVFRSGGSPASGKRMSGSRPYPDFKAAVDAL
jgi:protein-disulfide isomerase